MHLTIRFDHRFALHVARGVIVGRVVQHNVRQPDAIAWYAHFVQVVVLARIPSQALVSPLLQNENKIEEE